MDSPYRELESLQDISTTPKVGPGAAKLAKTCGYEIETAEKLPGDSKCPFWDG